MIQGNVMAKLVKIKTDRDSPTTEKVAVILPTYNRLATLPRALDSVLNQSFTHWELWVVDDGSTDGTEEWFHTWREGLKESHRIHFRRRPNGGVSAARNLAINESQGPWVAFLDSDDEWLPNKLQVQWEQIQKMPDLKVWHSEEIWIRRGVRVNPMKKHLKSGGRIFTQCLPLCCMSPSTIMIHRSIFEELGNFREDYPVCEDYEFWLRICSRYSVGFCPQALIKKYGGHEDQLSRRYIAMDYWRVLAMKDHLHSPHLSPEERQALNQTLQKKCRILLNGYKKHNNMEPYPQVNSILNDLIQS